jgi:hypothetical protein
MNPPGALDKVFVIAKRLFTAPNIFVTKPALGEDDLAVNDEANDKSRPDVIPP